MTDIVDDLRFMAKNCRIDDEDAPFPFEKPPYERLSDAVAEIERLRAELSAIRTVAGAVSLDGFNYSDFKRTGEGWPARKIKPDPNGEVS